MKGLSIYVCAGSARAKNDPTGTESKCCVYTKVQANAGGMATRRGDASRSEGGSGIWREARGRVACDEVSTDGALSGARAPSPSAQVPLVLVSCLCAHSRPYPLSPNSRPPNIPQAYTRRLTASMADTPPNENVGEARTRPSKCVYAVQRV